MDIVTSLGSRLLSVEHVIADKLEWFFEDHFSYWKPTYGNISKNSTQATSHKIFRRRKTTHKKTPLKVDRGHMILIAHRRNTYIENSADVDS